MHFRLVLRVYLLACALMFVACGDVFAGDDSNWPMAGFGPNGTGFNSVETELTPPLDFAWSNDLPKNATLPIVVGDRVYVATGATGHTITALNVADGSVIWDFDLIEGGGSNSVIPAFADGILMASGQGETRLYGINADTGTQAWIVKDVGSLFARPFAVDAGVLYAHGSAAGFFAVNVNDGSEVWSTGSSGNQTGVAVGGGRVYVVDGGTLRALNQETRVELWTAPGTGSSFTTPIYVDETVFISSLGARRVRSLNASDGGENWSARIEGELSGVTEGNLSYANGLLYLAVWKNDEDNGAVVALDADDGSEVWVYNHDQAGMLRPVIANGVVYIFPWKGDTILAVEPDTGDIIQTIAVDGVVGGGVVAQGMLFVVIDSDIHAFISGDGGSGCPQSASPSDARSMGFGDCMVLVVSAFALWTQHRRRAFVE